MKKVVSILMVLVIVLSFPTTASAESFGPRFAMTDEFVIIDYNKYPVVDNIVVYNNKEFEVGDGMLVYTGEETELILLPVEEHKVNDPGLLASLNDSICMNGIALASAPSNPVNLPYSANVPEGQWNTITPAFNLIESTYYYYTEVKLDNFSAGADKRFQVIFSICEAPNYDWTSHTYTQNFALSSTIKIYNFTSFRYGRISLCNLYGNPSPSYRYRVSMHN